MNRRSFIKSTGRGIALSGLTILGFTIARRENKQSTSSVCKLKLPCQKCQKTENCFDLSRRDSELHKNNGNLYGK